MRHKREVEVRTVYISFLVIFYFLLNSLFSFDIEALELIFISVIVLGYYLTDTLNFRITRYRMNDFIYPLIINSLLFVGKYLYIKEIRVLLMWVTFTLVQCVTRYMLIDATGKVVNVVILGDGCRRKRVERKLIEDIYNYIGYVGSGRNTLGSMEDLKRIITERSVDKVVVASDTQAREKLNEVLALKLQGVRIVDYLTFMEDVGGKIDHLSIDAEWIIKSRGFDILSSDIQKRIKRIFDITLSSILGMIVLPVVAVSALLVRLESPGPIFFRQKRVGEGDEEFEIIKFRSMRLHDPNEHSKYAGEKDNRITRFGNFMRKTRIDELPQLWLILKGDMSFVGPRPEWDILCEEYKEKIGEIYNIRHIVKPGVTGWAQVMYPYGAGVEDARNKLEYDLYYIKNQNFILDMLIFFKTVKTVVFGRGR